MFTTAVPITKLFAKEGGLEDMCYESCCLLLQYLIQSCACVGRRIVEDMCYEVRRAEACVD